MSSWIKFDKDDKTTWPVDGQSCLIHESSCGGEGYRLYDAVFHTYDSAPCFYDLDGRDHEYSVTHWKPLPEPPED